MLNRDYVNGLIHNDDAFTFLRCDRSSPAFWELKKKEVMAMIRQLGCPTLFLTLSAAETKWSELIVILTQVLENKVITLEEAENMSYEKKCDLIRNDPVTCVRYFEHRLKCLWEILSAPCGPFQGYELVDKYVRTEFQVRGLPHVHALLWLKNAPKYDENNPESIERCIEFIDKLISRSEYVHREANEFEQAFEEHMEREIENNIDNTNIEYDQDKNEFLIYEIGNNEGDIIVEMGLNTRSEKVEHFNVPKIIPDTEYQEMMRSLNNNQRRYTLNVMNLIKNGDKQFFHFINGGAGVGKSTLIKAVYQSILGFYNSLPGSNPESIRTAICAPTGKAAALIDGMTLHSFLSLPVNQCKHKLVKLDSDISNRIGVKLKDLQLLIIDEISM
ncbi:unnamed protein product, partial [Rotaria sordida]